MKLEIVSKAQFKRAFAFPTKKPFNDIDWTNALAGELGELCEAILSEDTVEIGKELADVYTYADIFASVRKISFTDKNTFSEMENDAKIILTKNKEHSVEKSIMKLASHIGKVCDAIKKEIRDDADKSELISIQLKNIMSELNILSILLNLNLLEEVVSKFNQVNKKINYPYDIE